MDWALTRNSGRGVMALPSLGLRGQWAVSSKTRVPGPQCDHTHLPLNVGSLIRDVRGEVKESTFILITTGQVCLRVWLR